MFKKCRSRFFLLISPLLGSRIYLFRNRYSLALKASISFLWLVFNCHIGIGQTYEFKKITTKEGLSHSTVYAITQDHNGFIWIGTREGLNRYDSYEIKSYYANNTSSDLPSNEIKSLLASKNKLYVGTRQGLTIYNSALDQFGPYYSGDTISGQVKVLFETRSKKVLVGTNNGLYVMDANNISTQIMKGFNIAAIGEYKKNVFWVMNQVQICLVNEIGEIIKTFRYPKTNNSNSIYRCLFTDSRGKVWLGTTEGLFLFEPEKDQFVEKILPLSHKPFIRSITADNENRLWLGTETGLYIYNPDTNHLIQYDQSFTKATNALSDRAIYKVFFSKEQMVWIGTYFGGINVANLKTDGFKKLLAGGALRGKAVSEIMEDSNGKIWIGTEDGGISIWDKTNGEFEYLNEKNGLSTNNIHAIYEDNANRIWIGTFFGGLYLYDPITRKLKSYTKSVEDSSSLSNNYVYAIEEDQEGNLLIGTQWGLNRYNSESDNFTLFFPQAFEKKFIYDIHTDTYGQLWIGTRFNGIYCYDQKLDQLEHFTIASHSLSSNQIISIAEDEETNLWFGTLNGGAIYWNRKTNTFHNITSHEGLPNNNVYGIISTSPSTVWMSTNKGLCEYDHQTGEFSQFNTSDGLSANQFNFKSYFKDSDGNLYFGTVEGLNYFHPDSTLLPQKSGNILFTDFKLFNKSVPIQENGILEQHINQAQQITLQYKENVLTFEFVNINHSSNGINQYACYLENFETDWNEIGNKRSATYTNLSPGQYIFHLKSNNSAERTIQLQVLPPFWRSSWAIALYFLGIIALIVLYGRFMRFLNKQRLAIQVEKLEKEKIRVINQHKLDFFTFISHEFKHPITLIVASIEKFFKENLSKISSTDEINSIKRNANRLQELVNQLIDFRSIEEKHASLHYSKGDIVTFVKSISQSFAPIFERKRIDFVFQSSHPVFHCHFDPDKIEKINANILSSLLHKMEGEGKILFSVDFSKPVEKDKRDILLTYTVTNVDLSIYQEDVNNQEISEIGWTLVQSLVRFLKGTIQIRYSEKNGEIAIQLPVILKGLTKAVAIIPKKRDFFIEKEVERNSLITQKQNFTLLILEQDRELLHFLGKYFSDQYKVLAVRSREAAQKKMSRHLPDLILADIFHDNKEGIEFCKMLKADPHTVHIPFIVLTTQASEQKKLEALEAGAEMFLTKPFHLKKLELIIQNTLNSRKYLQMQVSALAVNNSDASQLNNQEQEFLKVVSELVAQNYHRPDFSIVELAQKLNISRSLLHLKMKKITNASTSDFIQEIRMKAARALLKKGRAIREVAFEVGYNDPSYFSKAFKKKYGLSPGKFRRYELRMTNETRNS